MKHSKYLFLCNISECWRWHICQWRRSWNWYKWHHRRSRSPCYWFGNNIICSKGKFIFTSNSNPLQTWFYDFFLLKEVLFQSSLKQFIFRANSLKKAYLYIKSELAKAWVNSRWHSPSWSGEVVAQTWVSFIEKNIRQVKLFINRSKGWCRVGTMLKSLTFL